MQVMQVMQLFEQLLLEQKTLLERVIEKLHFLHFLHGPKVPNYYANSFKFINPAAATPQLTL